MHKVEKEPIIDNGFRFEEHISDIDPTITLNVLYNNNTNKLLDMFITPKRFYPVEYLTIVQAKINNDETVDVFEVIVTAKFHGYTIDFDKMNNVKAIVDELKQYINDNIIPVKK